MLLLLPSLEFLCHLLQILCRGTDLLSEELINPLVARFGVEYLPGILVKPSKNFSPDLILAYPTKEVDDLSYTLGLIYRKGQVVTMPGTSALSYKKIETENFEITELFVTDPSGGTWREVETTNFIDDTVTVNPAVGEKIEVAIPVVLALNRTVGDKEQKIIIMGDADCISNGEMGRSRKGIKSSNFNFIMGVFHWMSDGEVPIDIRRPIPIDKNISIGLTGMRVTKWSLVGLFPFAMFLYYIVMWIRRRGR